MHSARHRDAPWPAYLVLAFLGYARIKSCLCTASACRAMSGPYRYPNPPPMLRPASGQMQSAEYSSTPGRRSSLLRTCVEYLCTHRIAWLLLLLAAASPLAAGPPAFCIRVVAAFDLCNNRRAVYVPSLRAPQEECQKLGRPLPRRDHSAAGCSTATSSKNADLSRGLIVS